MSCLRPLKAAGFKQVHWLVKGEFANVLDMSEDISQIIKFDKKLGILGLISLAYELRNENYTHIYDAHSNIRSRIVLLVLGLFKSFHFARRGKDRLKRLILFKLKKNLLPWPFLGILSYLSPISSWITFKGRETEFQINGHFDSKIISKCDKLLLGSELGEDYIALAPSAAWEMKRWPLDYWKKLIELCPNRSFVILGGPGDKFCQELEQLAPSRVLNLAGKTSLIESCYLVKKSLATISADTGILHVADTFGKKSLALIGPTAFGFPSSKTTITLSVDLPCRPCTKDGRGNCSQETYQRCMIEITPERVRSELESLLRL